MALKDLQGSKRLSELSNADIRELQTLLVSAGYPLSIDGILGPRTELAFKKFKEGHRLTEPHLIGSTTIEYLIKYSEQYHPTKRKINPEGLALIKEFEGFRANAYRCPANVVTIGYGSTYYPNKLPIRMGDRITKAEGEKLLLVTVANFEDAVSKLVTVPLTGNQFSALVSFTFNVGIGAFKSSTLLKKLNRKDYVGASLEFSKWVKGGGKTLPGLVRRRNAEKALFLK